MRLSASLERTIGRHLTVRQRLVLLLGIFVLVLAALFLFRGYVIAMGPRLAFAGFAVLLISSIAASGVVSRSIVRPLARTIEYCDAIALGRYDTAIDVSLPDELGDVMRALDRMQDRLRENEATLRMMSGAIEHSPASIVMTDRDGLITYVNPKFSAVTGYSSAEAVGQSPRILKSGLQSAGFYQDLWATLSAGREWRGEFANRKKNGELFWERASISPIPDARGECVRFVAVKEDITDTKAAAEALQLAEQKYRDIVEHSIQGVYQTTPDGRFISANEALVRLFGCGSARELIEKPAGAVSEFYIDPDRHAEFVRLMEEHGAVSHFEARVRRADGRIIWTSENARAVRNPSGQLLHYEGFVDDITAAKEAEQLRSDFVSFVTHQLRTPLSGIRWMLELTGEIELPEEAASYIVDARASAERLIGLVNDLLDVARLESGRLVADARPTDLKALTDDVVAELMPLVRERRHDLSVTGVESPAMVLLDPQLGRQVVLNLLSNAIKYTPQAGVIIVQIRQVDDGLEWSVRDNGIGIGEAGQRRLFEKFYRADNARTVDTEGTGLGLYLVRLIIERSHGRIWCESTEGAGTTFRFTLPVMNLATGGTAA